MQTKNLKIVEKAVEKQATLDKLGIKEFVNKERLWMKKSAKHRHNHHHKVFNLGVWKSAIPVSTSDEEFKKRKKVIWAEKSIARQKLNS